MDARSAPDVVVTDLRPEHHIAVRQLVLDGLTEHWVVIDDSLNHDLDDIAGSYPGARTIVALEDGRVVGTATLVPRGAATSEIVRMSVGAGQRRQGVGRRLVEELVDTAGGWLDDRVVLETSTGWHHVVRFYERCGFAVEDVIEGDFGSETWMTRLLGPRSEATGISVAPLP